MNRLIFEGLLKSMRRSIPFLRGPARFGPLALTAALSIASYPTDASPQTVAQSEAAGLPQTGMEVPAPPPKRRPAPPPSLGRDPQQPAGVPAGPDLSGPSAPPPPSGPIAGPPPLAPGQSPRLPSAIPSVPGTLTGVPSLPGGKAGLPPASDRGPGPGIVPVQGSTFRLIFTERDNSLSEADHNLLTGVAARLATEQGLRLELRAYASAPDGSPRDARRISLDRAIAIRQFLVDKGIRVTRMNVRALGSTVAEDPQDRVDLVLVN